MKTHNRKFPYFKPVPLLYIILCIILTILTGCEYSDSEKDKKTYSVSGTIQVNENTAIDSDLNDPNFNSRSNDSFNEAQLIANPVNLGGYVNKKYSGSEGESYYTGDEYDYFSVSMSGDETITLYIADTDNADLDLYLYDSSGTSIRSEGPSSMESVSPWSADYYNIVVFAYDGASNYNLIINASGNAKAIVSEQHISDDFVPGEFIVRFDDNALKNLPESSPYQLSEEMGLQHKAGEHGRPILMQWGDNVTEKHKAFSALGIEEDAAGERHLGIQKQPLKEKKDTLRIARALRKRKDILYCEPNYIRKPLIVPDDEYYSTQWHYPLINLPEAWEVTTGTENDVIVAVIDTGVLVDHPDLMDQLVNGYDFISSAQRSNDGDGIDDNPDDPGDLVAGSISSFHGTHVAGTIAASTNNSIGIAGISWSARIMPLRVLGIGGGSSYDILQAIRFASGLANNSGTTPAIKAHIINLSLGGGSYSHSEQETYSLAREQGVIIIAAAGNSATDQPLYPASYDGVISVCAVDANKELSYYSNYGSTIDVAAPGGDMTRDRNGDTHGDGVLSTCGDDSSNSDIQMTYKFYQGTSMAAPHMSGVVALMKSIHPGLAPVDLDLLLESGTITEDIGNTGWDNRFGSGLIDAYKAVDEASGEGELPPVLSIDPDRLSVGYAGTTGVLTVQNLGGGTLNIESVTYDSDWLTVSEKAVDSNGLGSYLVTVSRDNPVELKGGAYSAVVAFKIAGGNSKNLIVLMQVAGEYDATADAGYQYILLLDSNTYENRYQVEATATNGEYYYEFPEVKSGYYHILAGTDSDNDFYIGDAGEAIGAYLSFDQPRELHINQDLGGLDFTSGFNLNLSGNASVGSTVQSQTIMRMQSRKKEVNP